MGWTTRGRGARRDRAGWAGRRVATLLFAGSTVLATGMAFPDDATARQVPGDGGARRAAPVLRAAAATGSVTVDGRLDEAAWAAAAPATGFVQLEPDQGRPASEPTEVRILVDDDAVYVGAHLGDGDPDGIVARLGRRDDAVQSDWFYAWFDGHRDRRTALGFGVNAAGVQRDLRVANDDDRDASWDAVWSAAVRRTPDGWTAELRIPLSQIRFTSGSAEGWGVQALRALWAQWAWAPAGQRNPPRLLGIVAFAGGIGYLCTWTFLIDHTLGGAVILTAEMAILASFGWLGIWFLRQGVGGAED